MSEPPIETTASSVMSPRQRRRAGTASALGTCIEAGDLVMYAFLVVYTAPLWFPSDDPAVSVVATLGVYGVGFLARPLGGLFFGRMGDRAGRRRTLVVTLALMGLATLSLGLIPTYETIGVFAPVLVILARILQGFAAGGEVMGAATYALESSSPGRRGLYSSLTPFGSYIGLFMATAVIGITNIIVGSAAMAAWGWRIPFFVGFVLTIALLMFRLRVEDSAEFTVLKKNNMIAKTPLRDTWRDHKLTILLTVLMGSGILYAAYSINTYVPVYLTTVTGLSRSEVPWMTAVVFLLASPAAIMGGLLADRFGRVRVLTIGLIAFGLSGIPVFAILADASFGIIGIGAVFFVAVVLGALLIAPAYQTFADIFPTRIRFTAAAIGFNLGGSSMMAATLSGKVAVVTGAGRGVGRAYALALAGEGAAVVVNDLPVGDEGRSNADEVVAEIVAAGGRAVAGHGNVADYDAASEIMDIAVTHFGRLDVLVANAGNTKPVSLLESTGSDWADVVAVHLDGTFNCIHHAANRMVRAGGGSVITTGDIQTDLIFPGLGAYRSAKAGIAVLTLQAAWELEKHHINVNSVMPGLTASAMSDAYMGSLGTDRDSFAQRARVRYGAEQTRPANGPASPESVPPLGVYLCTDAARSITGRLFQMAGGSTIRLVAPDVATFALTPDGDSWTMDELATTVPGLVSTAPVTSPS